MAAGALTPEELDTLLEDAFVAYDVAAVAELFEAHALLAVSGSAGAHGAGIAAFVAGLWERGVTYIPGPRRVLQVNDTALIVTERAISVARRAADARWHYAIALLDTNPKEHEMNDTAVTENARWWFDGLAVIKAGTADTNGQLTVVEVTEPPHAEAPLHVHHREDEAFYILEGSATFYVGDEVVVEARPGDFAFGPRHVPHRYTVGPDGCRILFICTPAGFEDLVINMSRPAESLTLPPATTQEPDWGHIAAVAAANQCELLS